MFSTARSYATATSSGRVHTPLIHFIGKRSWQTEKPHVHPAAPKDFNFTEFLKKSQSSLSSSSSTTGAKDAKPGVFRDFWQAPRRIWEPRVRQLSEAEMKAIETGGASYC